MARFKALGKEYELATVYSLSFDEARELKRISGFTTGPIVQALAETDPDAWLGLFTVSIQRVEGDFQPVRLAGENLLEVVASIEGDSVPLDEKDGEPPEEPATPAETNPPSDGSGETSPSAMPATPDEAVAPS